MSGQRALATGLVLGATLLVPGCLASPAAARVAWSDSDPVARPSGRSRRALGTLVVETDTCPGAVESDAPRRGFAVFDERGALVRSSTEAWGPEERVELPPGRYIVVASLARNPFEDELERAQAIVEAGATTRVDLSSRDAKEARLLAREPRAR